jgi:hypothetical protein
MLGFFNQPLPSTNGTTLPNIIAHIDAWTSSHPHSNLSAAAPPTSLRDTAGSTRRTQINGRFRPRPLLLFIGITPSPDLAHLTDSLSTTFPDLGLRVKQANHISLCYWDDPNPLTARRLKAKRAKWTDQAARLAQETIPLLNIPSGQTTVENESWDVVLYAITGRDRASGLPYPLEQVKRWTLSQTRNGDGDNGGKGEPQTPTDSSENRQKSSAGSVKRPTGNMVAGCTAIVVVAVTFMVLF